MAVAATGHPLAPGAQVVAVGGQTTPLSFCSCRADSPAPFSRLDTPESPVLPLTMCFTSDHYLLVGDAGGHVLACGPDGAQVWCCGDADRPAAPAQVNDLALSAEERFVASVGGYELKLWELHRDASAFTILSRGTLHRFSALATAVAFAPDDDRCLVVGLDDGRIMQVDRVDGREITIGRHEVRVERLRFSADGSVLLSASGDGVVRLWTRTGQPVLDLPLDGIVRGARFSPDGRRVVTASSQHTARVWPVRDEELLRLARELPFRGYEAGERDRLLQDR